MDISAGIDHQVKLLFGGFRIDSTFGGDFPPPDKAARSDAPLVRQSGHRFFEQRHRKSGHAGPTYGAGRISRGEGLGAV